MARRFGLYLFGVAIGSLMVYFMFLRDSDGRYSMWTPDNRIKEQLRGDPALITAERTQCLLRCAAVSEADFELLLDEADTEIDGPAGERDVLNYTLRHKEVVATIQWVRSKEQASLQSIRKGSTDPNCDC